jgi:hypothetical protein
MTTTDVRQIKLLSLEVAMNDPLNDPLPLNDLMVPINRRSFVKSGLTAAGAATVGAGVLLSHSPSVLAKGVPEERSGHLDKGDAAILRFARGFASGASWPSKAASSLSICCRRDSCTAIHISGRKSYPFY